MIINLGRGVSLERFNESLPEKASIIIKISDWVNKSCTKTVIGMNPNLAVIAYPNESSSLEYNRSQIKISTQGNETITFVCETVPFSDIIVEILVLKTRIVGDGVNSLSISGDWANDQYVNFPIDYTGLTFIATYNDGNTLSVKPTSSTPSSWGSTAGTQSCTFNYTESGITVSASKSATVKPLIPVSLVVDGDWTNAQIGGEAPDIAGLTFTATYIDGSDASVTPTSVAPSVWATDSGIQTATFSYTDGGVTVTTTKDAIMTYTYSTVADGHGSVSGSGNYTYDADNSQTKTISATPDTGYYFTGWATSGGSSCSIDGDTLTINAGCYGNIVATASFELIAPTSLTITGDWSNSQQTEQAVDYTGLTFTCTYTDGSSATVTPTSYSPTVWGSTAGTQTCTFTYTEYGVSVSASKSVNVEEAIPSSLTITGDWDGIPSTDNTVDITGLIFTCNYSDGTSTTVTPTSYTPTVWSSTEGEQIVTFNYTEGNITVSTTKSANVEKAAVLNSFRADTTATTILFT